MKTLEHINKHEIKEYNKHHDRYKTGVLINDAVDLKVTKVTVSKKYNRFFIMTAENLAINFDREWFLNAWEKMENLDDV